MVSSGILWSTKFLADREDGCKGCIPHWWCTATNFFLLTIDDLMEFALVNPAKIELGLFTRSYNIEEFRLPRLKGGILEGIILDSIHSWKRSTEERMKNYLCAFYTYWRTTWKLSDQYFPKWYWFVGCRRTRRLITFKSRKGTSIGIPVVTKPD